MSRFEGHPDADEVLRDARGRWGEILKTLIPASGCDWDAIADNPLKAKTFCPLHGGKSGEAFCARARKGYWDESGTTICNSCGSKRGFKLIMETTGKSYDEAIIAVYEVLHGQIPVKEIVPPTRRAPLHRQRQGETEMTDEQKITSIMTAWNEAVPLSDPKAAPALRYFVNRGITPVHGPLEDLRFHPALLYKPRADERANGMRYTRSPALLGMFRQPDGQRVTAHRIYITEEGRKAPFAVQKKVFPVPGIRSMDGGAFRLDPVSPVLNVAEGIESALAVRALTDFPTWSCYSKDILSSFVPPPEVKVVLIWPDLEYKLKHGQAWFPGMEACHKLVERLRERGIRAIPVPPAERLPEGREKLDWNDLLREQGREKLRQASGFYARLMERLARELDQRPANTAAILREKENAS